MGHAAGLSPDTLDMVVGTLREVLSRFLPDDKILGLDERDEFPTDVLKELLSPDVGMHLLFLPEEAGGLGGGSRDVCRMSEEMARVDLGVATAFLAIFLGTEPILVGGTPEQRARWLSKVASEGLVVAYGVTEPEAGSNVVVLKTTAERVLGPDGKVASYRLNGTKQFITNGGVASLYTILARAPDGPTFFVVERHRRGLHVGKKEHKHGIRASNTTAVVLEDVVVPAENLIGGVEGKGLEQASAVFGHTRLMVGAFGLGAGFSAIERAVRYARERVQFGGPLLEKEGYALKLLVPHLVDLEAGKAYGEEIAARLDEGTGDLPVEGAIAKYWSTEAGIRAADAALQAHGGYGYMREYMVEKIRRDVRITSIYEGTSEILQSIVGMHRWKEHVRSRGAFYADLAAALEALPSAGEVGAGPLAAAGRSLSAVLAYAQEQRLPRHQVALFSLADLATRIEVSAGLARKASRLLAAGEEGAGRLATMSRIAAREAAREVARVGRLLAAGFVAPGDEAALSSARALAGSLAPLDDPSALAGQWTDMAAVAATL